MHAAPPSVTRCYNSKVRVKTSFPGVLPIEVDRDSAVPIAIQLEEQLTWLIATRVLAPGDRLPSLRRLGLALGIHHHTVRQAYRELQARDLISMRPGATATVREISTLRLARPRYTGGMVVWGILIAGFSPFYLPFLRGVERGAAEAHAMTILSVTEDSHVKATLQMQQLVAAGVGGIIAASMGQLVRAEVGGGAAAALPVVYCDQPRQAEESIVFDSPRAGYELAEHLADHGRRRVTLMTPSLDYPNMAALHRGFMRAARAGLIEVVEVLQSADFSVEAGEAAASASLSSDTPPTAIATVADELALGVLGAARKLGLSVPNDLSVVSYGAIDSTAHVDPPITTVALPAEQMGHRAAGRLAERIRGESAAGRTILAPQLVVRSSCGPHDP